MEEKDMTLIEHLEELRKRLFITLGSLIVFFIIGSFYAKDLYEFFVKDIEDKLTILGPTDVLWVYLMIMTVFAVTCTIPVLALQIWLFVKPALRPKEQKVTLTYVPALFFLFIGGLSFGYFVVFPTVMNFLMSLSGEMFETMFTTEKYFKFLLNMTLPFGILFELPLVIMFLTSMGLINPVFLQKNRKYAYFILVVVGVVVSPPDFISDFLVIVPLLFLYEVSLTLSRWVYRKRLKANENEGQLID